jgi:hypothetical protein
MSAMARFDPGGYSYLRGGFQYSFAVMADPGWEIERVRFSRPVALDRGFELIEKHIASCGRPIAALCACELRSPAPLADQDFIAFNRAYVGPLARWGIFRDDINPVTRCNLCPEIDPPQVPSFYAFAYTVPRQSSPRASFATGGAADCPDGKVDYQAHIIRPGDISVDGLRAKLRFALGDLEERLGIMNVSWADVTHTRLYTVRDIHPLVAEEFVHRGAMPGGLTWHYCRPPVKNLELEVDTRGVARQVMIEA